MTEHERSLRQRAIEHIAKVRKGLNPQTTEHVANAAREAATPELRAYAEYTGWASLKHLEEDAGHAAYRPGRSVRSGHKNASGKFRALRNILEMRYTVGEVSRELGELTIPELKLVVVAYDKRSNDLAVERDRLQRIVEAAEEKGVSRVKQLGSKRVEALYRGEAVNA